MVKSKFSTAFSCGNIAPESSVANEEIVSGSMAIPADIVDSAPTSVATECVGTVALVL